MKNRKWQHFKIDEIFEVFLSKDDLQPKKLTKGTIPLISSGKTNNGISMYINLQKNCTLYLKGHITVDMFGKAFYQNQDFYCVSHGRVNILKPKFIMDDNVGLFICTIINKTINMKYSFKKMCSSKAISKEIISLPVTKEGKIDLDFIQNFMLKESNIVEKRYLYFQNITCQSKKNINTKTWKYFKIGDIFNNIVSPKVYHLKDVKENPEGIPYVVRSKYNNGVKCFIEKEDYIISNPGGVISFGAENATFFYQENEYVSGRDMYYIDTRNISKDSIMFLITCLQKVTNSYSYNYGLFPKLLKEEFIKLPQDSDGNPDWDYMDKYVKQLKTSFKV